MILYHLYKFTLLVINQELRLIDNENKFNQTWMFSFNFENFINFLIFFQMLVPVSIN